MSDAFRRILEEQAAMKRLLKPLEDAERALKPAEDAMRLGIGARILDVLEQEEKRRQMLAGLGSKRALADAAKDALRYRELLDGPIEEAKRYGLLDPMSDKHSAISSIIHAQKEYEKLFHRPSGAELSSVAREAIAHSQLVRTVLGTEDQVQAALAALSTPWLKFEDLASAQAMASILAIGKGIDALPGFDENFAVALRNDLGDWRDEIGFEDDQLINPLVRSGIYSERGFNQDLTNFTPETFNDGLQVAGLRGQAYENSAEAGSSDARAVAAFDQLNRFERAVRDFIETVMKEEFGDDWMKSRLPSRMLELWVEKRDRAIKAGEVEQRLIDYADFTDYKAIIERTDNWKQVFQPIFGRAEDVRESFQRLFPVRIATMHARIVTQDDELLLVVETRRVLNAIRKLPGA